MYRAADELKRGWKTEYKYIPKKAVCCIEHINDDSAWQEIQIVERNPSQEEYEELCDSFKNQINV